MYLDLKQAADNLLRVQENESIWNDSTFESFHYLCADYSGKAGEDGFYNFMMRTRKNGLHQWDVEYDGDSNTNQNDGTYDMIIYGHNRNTLGIKTARIGKGKQFQHDNLHDNECDFELLIDITPNFIYLTILNFKEYTLKEKHPIFGLKPHLRKNTSNNFKLDLRESHLEKGIIGNISLRVDNNTDDNDIINFLSQILD